MINVLASVQIKQNKTKKKTETVHADQKSAPNICAHCSLPPPKTSRKIHCST